jgi:LPXTG-motif cell wall-anchored protein
MNYGTALGGETMRLFKIAGITIAALFTVTPSALAQTQAKTSDTAAIQTFTGCLMTEPAYRRAHNLGEGQIGGVGLGDEFVLVDVKVSPAKGMAATAPASGTSAVSASASASTCSDQGLAYRLSGSPEEKIKGLVGHQLEIQGRFKHAADAAAGGTRPGEKLPAEVEIVSFREAPSPAAVSEPVASVPPVTPPSTSPATVEPPRAPATRVTEPRELPHTASSSALLTLVGVLALSSGVVLTVLRRRAL